MTHHLDFNRLIKVSKSLADLVEAIIKVVYIDKNHSIDIVHEIFKGLLDPMISLEILDVHPMTKLYEMCQKKSQNKIHEFMERKHNCECPYQ
jgi:dsRNA-specific ribonuclease